MDSIKNQLVRAALGCLVATFWVTGCGKNKPEDFPASNASGTPATPATPATSATSGSSAAAAPKQASADNQKTYADAEAAMKARDYEKAVEAALVLQQQKLTEAQAQAAHNQMMRLQQQIAGAALSGDPKAKAAADRLRQAAAHR